MIDTTERDALARTIHESFYRMQGGEGPSGEPINAGDVQLAVDILAERGAVVVDDATGWEYGQESRLHDGVWISPIGDLAAARRSAWLFPLHRRRAPGPWEPLPLSEATVTVSSDG